MAGMSKRKSIETTKTEIAARAYEIFLKRGGQHGHSVEDWLQAERELLTDGALRQTSKTLPLGLRLIEQRGRTGGK
jgi:hypothetical protein